MPWSRSSMRGCGSCPTASPSQERSTSSIPSGTATESFGSPVTVVERNTLPARPARSRFDVSGTTSVCQTSTPRTSLEETTTHGRCLSTSTQCTAPRLTNVPTVASVRRLREHLDRSVDTRLRRVLHLLRVAGRTVRPLALRGYEVGWSPTGRTVCRGCR